jgi:predicted lipoprotein with Yx(FWY)xxD motif
MKPSRRNDRPSFTRGTQIRSLRILALAAVLLLASSVAGTAAVHRSASNTTVRITTRNVKGLGPILVNSKGLTLYMFVPDKQRRVTCVSTCAALWPPLYLPTGAKLAVSGKVKRSLISTDRDPAGGRVVTYARWPLYTYVADTKPGMTTGQALNINGGLWYVLSPNGTVLHKKVRIAT